MFRHPVLSLTRRSLILALCVVGPLVLSPGCTSSGGEGAGSPGAPGSGAATGSGRPGVLRYPLTAEPTTLDPALVRDGATIDMLQSVYEGLVGWNEKNEVAPLIAAELPEVSADGKTYTFKIREGAKFHNGRAITAEDIKYSITRSLDKKLNSPVALSYLSDIQGATEWNAGKATELSGVRVVDPKTVRITLVAPRAYFLGKLTYLTAAAVPKEEVEKGEKTVGGAFTITEKNSVGSGPFRLKEYRRQDKIVLEANADYWNGAPKLTSIERPIILDAKTARNLFDSGELDYVTLEKGDYETLKDDPSYQEKIKRFDRASTFYLGMNLRAYAPFKDKRVRQAFAHAIDKDAIVNNVLLGVNQKAEGVVPKGIFSFDPEFKGLPYDAEKAKKLLTDAGFPGGKGMPPLPLYFREQQPDLRKTAEVIKEQLAAIGVQVSLNEMEWGAFLKANENFKTEAFHMRWGADYLDPQNFLSLLLSTTGTENYTGYSNPAYDKLCAQADSESDPAKRTALYRQAERIVVDDAPWVPLYYQRDLELMQPWVTDIRDSLFGHLPHLTTQVR
ncbi:MAG: peptide ABC transporter substrate-binding protein [Capsulimonadales bacterium]|nr:peptide ABC transporter substrate-binding protein [Capsulimonadales bacterium]